MKKAKWVDIRLADEPISKVAAQVIRQRLEEAWKYALLTAKHWRDEPENLHRMRVSTRRSAAAMATFAELLPAKRARKMRKRLKRLRKASGTARDLDVLAERLRRDGKAEKKDHARVLARLHELRRDAQLPIETLINKLETDDFPRQIAALCKRIRWRGEGVEPCYAQEARRLMHEEAENFLAAAAENAQDHHALHQLRIAGKQLRYTMEVLAGGLGEKFRGSLYADLRELQDKLGAINDHAVAHNRFQDWSAGADRKLAQQFMQFSAAELDQAEKTRIEFLQWWNGERCGHFTNKLRQAVAEAENLKQAEKA